VASLQDRYEKLIGHTASNIKKMRKSNGFTQSDMEDFGFEIRNYQRIESGKNAPSVYTLFRLAVAFKVDIREFFKP